MVGRHRGQRQAQPGGIGRTIILVRALCPLSRAPRSALPLIGMAITSPSPSSTAICARTRMSAASSAYGSIIRNTVEKVSSDGMECLSFRKFLKI